MKKHMSLLMAAAMSVSCLSACGQASINNETQAAASEVNTEASATETEANDANEKKLKVVTTIFPEYDWVKNIAGEEAENMDLTMLLAWPCTALSQQPMIS